MKSSKGKSPKGRGGNPTTDARVPLCYALCGLLLLSCSTIRYTTGQDPLTSFETYKTFAFAAATSPPRGGDATAAADIDLAVKNDLTRELMKKGLVEAERSAPDLIVSYSAIDEEGLIYGRDPKPWRFAPIEEDPATREESLTLQFIDPKHQAVVWQGTATHVIANRGNPRKEEERIAEALRKLLERYPS